MAYNPTLYNPYGLQPQQPVDTMVWISSTEEGWTYPVAPGSVSPPLWLTGENAFLRKQVDEHGSASLKRFLFNEVPLEEKEDSELYVTKEYFDSQLAEIKEAINGERIASEQPKHSNQK